MSNLHDLINLLKDEVDQQQSTYVYYNKQTGIIHKICGSINDDPLEDEEILKVAHEVAEPILSGEKRTNDFIVKYDIAAKQKVLKEKNYEDSYKHASQMCFKLPIIKSNRSGHIGCTEIYDGMAVLFWIKERSYKKNELVWFKNNVYKLLKPNLKGKGFNAEQSTIVVENVAITDISTQELLVSELTHTHEYKGVHIDVWYKALSHLAGQHVWINSCVYRFLKDQPAKTEFDPDSAELLIANVNLNHDENENLDFIKHISDGDTYLKDNKLYSAKIVKNKMLASLTTKDVIFQTDENHILLWRHKSKSTFHVNTVSASDDFLVGSELYNLTEQNNLKNGDKILLGSKLYQVQRDAEYDIIITQDNLEKHWHINLNPSTLTYFKLNNFEYDDEQLYFSITAKHDPNILYRSLSIPIKQLGEIQVIPFDDSIETNDVSIYTAKYFSSYAHEVVK